MEVMTQLVAQVGFPIVVSIYLLLQNEKMRQTLEHNTNALTELTTTVKMLHDEKE